MVVEKETKTETWVRESEETRSCKVVPALYSTYDVDEKAVNAEHADIHW